VIKLTQGDLLAKDDVDAVVNAVNCVGVMGKGIALQFKHRWPANFGAYATACQAGQVRPGRMFIYDLGGLVQPHHIINFPTKDHWREESRIQFINAGLVDLVAQVRRLGIRSIAIPPLGCGNGGLRWADVRPLIQAAFEPLPEVEVRLFEPDCSGRALVGRARARSELNEAQALDEADRQIGAVRRRPVAG
jgi:O-acetyl-ADP-ribose deacetylase (regulator of RNase III)